MVIHWSKHGILLAGLITVSTGCSVSSHEPTLQEAKGVRIYSSTADLQAAFMKDHDSQEHFCASRIADVADTVSQGVSLSASAAGQGEGFSEGASRGAVDLGGRSPAVLITREIMYRTCEIMMNFDLPKEDALELYKHALDLALAISQAETTGGAAPIASTGPEISVGGDVKEN